MNAMEARMISDKAVMDNKKKELEDIYDLISKRAKQGEYSLCIDEFLYDETIKQLKEDDYVVRYSCGSTVISWEKPIDSECDQKNNEKFLKF